MSLFWCSIASEGVPVGICVLESTSTQHATDKIAELFPWITSGMASFEAMVCELSEDGAKRMQEMNVSLEVLYPPSRRHEVGGAEWHELPQENRDYFSKILSPEKFN